MRIWSIILLGLFFYGTGLVYAYAGLNLAMLAPIYFLYQKKYIKALISAFTGGLVMDLVNLTPLGLSSLLMLLGIGFLWFLWEKAVKENLVAVFAAFFGFDLLFHLAIDGKIELKYTFITAGIYMLFFLIWLRVLKTMWKSDDIFLP